MRKSFMPGDKLIGEIDKLSKDERSSTMDQRRAANPGRSLRKIQRPGLPFAKLEALNVHCRQTDRLVMKLRELVGELYCRSANPCIER
jgi:hypothetical protein